MIGRTVGNYVIRAKVGEGGMGVVYVAEHPHISRRVAIKVLHPGADRASEVVQRFFTEARAASEIRNEHIVDVLDFGELPEATPYLVMEWLEGQSLASLLRAERKLAPARAAHVVRGIAKALRAAHAKGVVHRDLKPDNVFLVPREGDPEFVKVLDFGIAKLIASDAPVAPADYKTQTGAIMGTPAYMSPEQCRGAKEIDHRTDIYSLGVIAYQMLTGRLPFVAESLGELLFKHLGETAPAPAALDPAIPAAVSAAVARALEKDPGQRPTLAELSAVMEAVGPAPGAGAAAASAPAAPPDAVGDTMAAAAVTTLGGGASEIDLERRLLAGKKRRLLTTAVIVAGAGTAAIIIAASTGGHAPAPSPAEVTQPAAATAPATVPPAAAIPPGAPVEPSRGRADPQAAKAAPADGGAAITTPAPAAVPAPASRRASKRGGYRGDSKLQIETEFPGGGR